MGNVLGGGADDEIQPGAAGGAPGGNNPSDRPTESGEKAAKQMNQDLWLLNLFFKGCAFIV